MAEQSDQERTEEPTEKRLQDARNKGQVARSKEMNTFGVMFAGATVLVLSGRQMLDQTLELYRRYFSLTREQIFDPRVLVDEFYLSIFLGLSAIGPILLTTVVAAFISSILLSGWVFSWQALAPKFERLSPIKGLARIFSVRGLVELVKAILKTILILGVATVLFQNYIDEFLALNQEPLLLAISHAGDLVGISFLVLCVSLAAIVVIDVPYQLWDHKRQLKMTKQQVKDEAKERDGNPQLKARIRSVQIEMAQQRMMEKVPKADVVVTNPTHFAVALGYDSDQGDAPRVLAKGKDIMAAQIRTLARGAGVPLVEAPPLARALYFSVKLDAAISQELYLAVAQVLAYVYQVNDAKATGREKPLPPDNIPVPDSFQTSINDHE